MRNCPKCGAQYDNETLLFCTRDGTPLLPAANEPEFTDMPSESWPKENWDEDTVVISKPGPEKIVVPTGEPQTGPSAPRPPVQPRPIPPYQPPPRQGIGLTILLTALCTVAVIALAIALWWAMNGGPSNMPANGNLDANLLNNNYNANASMFNINTNYNLSNINMNTNANFNSSTGFNSNFNSNANFNANANANANLKPSPTPKLSPTPKPSPSEIPDDGGDDGDGPTPTATPKAIDAGMLNSRVLSLPTPTYPASAKSAGISGSVSVNVMVDEQGNVTSARAVSGPVILRPAAEAAARQARFRPPKIGTQPTKMTGMLLFNFQ